MNFVMPTIENENMETEEEDMEQDSPEADNSSEDESDGSVESSDIELDEEECAKRRIECLDDMVELERQFSELREQLYRERINQINTKLEEMTAGRSVEYLERLRQLQEQMHIRTQVAGILRDLRIKSCQIKHESEELAANQHMRSEKLLLFDSIKSELEEKIRRLEEDRHNIDISSDLWNESQSLKKNSKRKTDPFNLERRRKPVTVTGPYIVYMLKDVDIIDDWTAIKKALKQQQQQQQLQKRRPEYKQTIQVR